jgi:hypothetical protein
MRSVIKGRARVWLNAGVIGLNDVFVLADLFNEMRNVLVSLSMKRRLVIVAAPYMHMRPTCLIRRRTLFDIMSMVHTSTVLILTMKG